jgi:hypothetical protein
LWVDCTSWCIVGWDFEMGFWVPTFSSQECNTVIIVHAVKKGFQQRSLNPKPFLSPKKVHFQFKFLGDWLTAERSPLSELDWLKVCTCQQILQGCNAYRVIHHLFASNRGWFCELNQTFWLQCSAIKQHHSIHSGMNLATKIEHVLCLSQAHKWLSTMYYDPHEVCSAQPKSESCSIHWSQQSICWEEEKSWKLIYTSMKLPRNLQNHSLHHVAACGYRQLWIRLSSLTFSLMLLLFLFLNF